MAIANPNYNGRYESLFTGLVAAYDFKGDAKDWSGNGNDGTVTGPTLTTDYFNIANSAYNFDGVDDYIDVGTPLIDPVTDSFTISFWVKSDDSFYTRPVFIGNNHDNLNGFYILYQGDTNIFRIKFGGTSYDYSSINFADTNWHHIVMTYDTTTRIAEVFIDGSSIGTQTESSRNSPIGVMQIGAYNNGASNVLDGVIDEVFIWNRTLSADEVKTLYDLQSKKDIYTYGF